MERTNFFIGDAKLAVLKLKKKSQNSSKDTEHVPKLLK